MEDIFEIRFSFEQKVKDDIIVKFSNKQGGDYNVFSYYWQCFAWAAVIGFFYEQKRSLQSPLADKPFSLNTMRNNNGEKTAQALLCMCIAKAGTLDILKDSDKAITLINEYANGGFYYIQNQIDNGENSFNDLEKVKQEIFNRNIL
ncbi:dnd system-associated protein 4 [Bacteroidales bacterium Barb6]|nr:dnd system-associated protein 4 [Bacteroidales bacterium Barb6]